MKQCPKCQEMNLDEAAVCSKCGAALNETLPSKQEAAVEAAVSADNAGASADNVTALQRDTSWMRFTAIFFPYFGFLYSVALVAAKDEDEAKSICLISAVSFVVQFVIILILAK